MSDFPPPPPSSIPPSDGPPAEYNSGPVVSAPAQVGLRLIAFVLDSVFYAVLSMLTILVVRGGDSFSADGQMMFSSGRLGISIPWMVLSALFFRRATSPGKIPVRLRIVDARTGQPATFAQMALREWGGKVALGVVTAGLSWLIGGFMVVRTPDRRGLWDYVARTKVVIRD